MRAILLAAGLGTRLKPLTDTIPKCLVPINNTPLLEIWLEELITAGIKQILINTYYLSEQVESYLLTSKYNQQVTLVNELELLGTAGTLIKNLDFFREETGLLIHADNYCRANITEFINAHNKRPPGCLITMMTFKTDDPSSCGIVKINKDGVVVEFNEKVKYPQGDIANGAVYIISNEFINILKSYFKESYDFSREILPHFTGRIYTYHNDIYHRDIGNPKSLALCQLYDKNNNRY